MVTQIRAKKKLDAEKTACLERWIASMTTKPESEEKVSLLKTLCAQRWIALLRFDLNAAKVIESNIRFVETHYMVKA